MAMQQKELLVIGSLPPFRTAAAAMGLYLANLLRGQFKIHFVIDDLAPPPPQDLGFPFMRLHELKNHWQHYQNHTRLYVAGEEGDSLFALDLMGHLPGLVVPAILTLFPLAESLCRIRGGWPDNYWHWLRQTCGETAELLYAAQIHSRRQSEAQALETPAFDLLLEKAIAIIAPSPALERSLKASGLQSAITLPVLPVVSQTQAPACYSATTHILYVCENALVASRMQENMALYTALKPLIHQTIHPASQHLEAAIHEADTIVFLDQNLDSASPALSTAMAGGKAIITAGQPWAAALPKGCHLSVPHSKAFDTLAITLGALFTVPGLQQSLKAGAKRSYDDLAKGTLAELVRCIGEASLPAGKLETTQMAVGKQPAADVTAAPMPETLETAALIGAVPPPSVLQAILPDLDLDRCPRFATPELSNRLVSITNDHPAKLLARMGYEAPLVKCHGVVSQAHRVPLGLPVLLQSLKCENGIAFACDVEGAIPGRELLKLVKTMPHMLIKVAYDEDNRRAPDHGYIGENGLFWHHDTVRHSMQYILMVGLRNATFRVKAASPDTSFMVASETSSELVGGAGTTLVQSDALGVLEFRIAAIDAQEGTPLASSQLRKLLAESGLILEWSAS